MLRKGLSVVGKRANKSGRGKCAPCVRTVQSVTQPSVLAGNGGPKDPRGLAVTDHRFSQLRSWLLETSPSHEFLSRGQRMLHFQVHPSRSRDSIPSSWGFESRRSFGILVDLGILEPERDESHEEREQRSQEVIQAVKREGSGKIVAKRERREGRIPGVVYEQANGDIGGNKELISVPETQLKRMLRKYGRSFFFARTFDLEVSEPEGEEGEAQHGSVQRVLPRAVHAHASKDSLLNITFLRVLPGESLAVDIPLVFTGEDACPGIRRGGFLNTIRRTVRCICPSDEIPPQIEVDLSRLQVGDKLLLSDLPLPSGIKLVIKDLSFPVCKIGGKTSLREGATE